MTHQPIPALQVRFVSADDTFPDPAAVAALARTTVSALRTAGEPIDPLYTGEKGGAEVFAWLLGAELILKPFISITDLALKIAQLLNEIKKLRGNANNPPPPPTQPITIIVRIEGAAATVSTATISTSTAPSDTALLSDLLAQTLPAEVDPAAVTVEVRVPPTPPNDL